MSAQKSSPGGMLGCYVQEQYAVLEQEVCMASQHHNSGVTGHASTTGYNGKNAAGEEHHKKAVDDLDKYMAAVTESRILKQGREDRRGEFLIAASAPKC
jgi:hypothetical protein